MAVGLLGGCSENPSFRVRWTIDLRDDDQPLENEELPLAAQCSLSGIRQVAIATFDSSLPEGDDLVDLRQRACAPENFSDPEGGISGPRVSSGPHQVMTLGLTAAGRIWFDDPRPRLCRDEGECAEGFDCVGAPIAPCSADEEEQPGGDRACFGVCEPRTECSQSFQDGQGTVDQTCPLETTCEDVPDDGCPDAEGRGVCAGTCEQRPLADLVRCDPIDETSCILDLPDGPDGDELTPRACSCASLDVTNDDIPLLDGFSLRAPDNCEDGIDNDRDGLLDARDPGCQLSDRESDDANLAQIDLTLSFFEQNEAVSCINVGVIRFEAIFDDDESTRRTIPCSAVGRSISLVEAAEEDRTLSVVAIGRDGEPATETKEVPVSVPSVSSVSLDFPASDFLEPIEAPINFTVSFPDAPAPNSPTTTRGCTGGRGDLNIAELRVEVLDARGGVLAPAVTLADGTPLDGSPIPCPTGSLLTEVLSWGGYLLDIDAVTADGDVCFSTDPGLHQDATDVGPLETTPSGLFSFNVVVPRILNSTDDGPAAPPGCNECGGDKPDCPGEFECRRGLCVPQ